MIYGKNITKQLLQTVSFYWFDRNRQLQKSVCMLQITRLSLKSLSLTVIPRWHYPSPFIPRYPLSLTVYPSVTVIPLAVYPLSPLSLTTVYPSSPLSLTVYPSRPLSLRGITRVLTHRCMYFFSKRSLAYVSCFYFFIEVVRILSATGFP